MHKEPEKKPNENKTQTKKEQINTTVTENLISEENIGQTMKELKDDVKEDTPSSLTIEKKEAVVKAITIDNEVRRFKFFFVSDMDEEARYLHQMSGKGLHFVKKESIFYVFKKGEPQNYCYYLSYFEKGKRDGERYISNYEDAGWTNVYHEKGEYDGIWNYFRTEITEGEVEPNIYSDRLSRIALYKRLLNGWKSLLAVVLICFLFMVFITIFLYMHPFSMMTTFTILSAIVIVVMIIAFVIYLRAYLRINKKLQKLLDY